MRHVDPPPTHTLTRGQQARVAAERDRLVYRNMVIADFCRDASGKQQHLRRSRAAIRLKHHADSAAKLQQQVFVRLSPLFSVGRLSVGMKIVCVCMWGRDARYKPLN